MRQFFQKTLLLISTCLLLSCNFVETIDIQENGSGAFAVQLDASGLLAMGGDQLGEKMGMKQNEKTMDTIITFKSVFESKKDSIATLSPEEQAALKRMENTVMHMKMDPDKKEFFVTLNSPFTKITELQNLMEGFSLLQSIKKSKTSATSKSPFGGSFGDNNSKLSFSYNGKTFSRNVEMIKDKEVVADTTGMSKMLFASSTYTLKYHFPKPVKSTSNPDALFSGDRKTITVIYPFSEYMDNPKKLNLNVEFE